MLTLLLPLSNYFTIFGETQGSTDVDLTSIDRVRVLCSKERGQKKTTNEWATQHYKEE